MTAEVSDVNTIPSNSQPQPSIPHTEMQGTFVSRARGLIPRNAMTPKLNTKGVVIYQQPQPAVAVTKNMRPQLVPYPPMPTNSTSSQPSTTTSSSSQGFMQFIPTPKGPPTN
ncbi:HIT domain-containing protein [Sesbania bispinosa]|nr:HIT domain-containing protein [Sesbania bispinosa]